MPLKAGWQEPMWTMSFLTCFDDLRDLDTRRAVLVAACAGGALEERLDKLVIEGDLTLHHFLQEKHLAAGVVGRSKSSPIHRADRLAEPAARTLEDLFPVLFHKIVFGFHCSYLRLLFRQHEARCR